VVVVAVAVQADAEVGGGLDAGEVVDDGPELALGGGDEAVHAVGRVQADDHVDVLDLGGVGRLRLFGRGGPGGDGGQQAGEQAAQQQPAGVAPGDGTVHDSPPPRGTGCASCSVQYLDVAAGHFVCARLPHSTRTLP